nr:hypothetical protein [Xylella fastidiosa]
MSDTLTNTAGHLSAKRHPRPHCRPP